MNHHDHHPAGGGPPPVEMPKPTIWPMILSLGVVLLAAGVAASPAYYALGGLIFAFGLAGWVGELIPGRGHGHEPVVGPLPQSVDPRPGTVEHLDPSKPGYRFRLPEKMHPISAGVKGGLAGGLVMPIPALAWGQLSGHGIWFPVNLLAGTVLPGVDQMTVEQLERFSPVLLAIGIVIHVVISLSIGLMYGVILPTLPQFPGGQFLCGGLIIPLLWTGASHSLMGVLNPALQQHVDWRWFVASQIVFGLVAAIVVVNTEQVYVAPAGRGHDPDHHGGTP